MMQLTTYKAAFEKICDLLTELDETDDEGLQSRLADFKPPKPRHERRWVFPNTLKKKADVTQLLVVMEILKADLEEAILDDIIVSKYDAIESQLGSATDSLCEILQTLDRSLKEFDTENIGEFFGDIEACVGYLDEILEEEEE